MAEVQGSVMLRPWRVGLLTDISSSESVREAIASLSSVWGGLFMPILDEKSTSQELEQAGFDFDLDSLYSENSDSLRSDLPNQPGWDWGSRGPWGPFSSDQSMRKGLLPSESFLDDSKQFVQPSWNEDDPSDLFYSATWGRTDRFESHFDGNLNHEGPKILPHLEALEYATNSKTILGALALSSVNMEPARYPYEMDGGIYVIRPEHPEDVVEFWNMRILNPKIIAVPAEAAPEVVGILLSTPLPFSTTETESMGADEQRQLEVWGLEDASDYVSNAISLAAVRNSQDVINSNRGDFHRLGFRGLTTRFSRSIRASFRPEARWVDIDLPVLPITYEQNVLYRGVVAAEVSWHSAFGQDPRMTASVPPFRSQTNSFRGLGSILRTNHLRASDRGLVVGIEATEDRTPIPFAYNLDVMSNLFGSTSKLSQSDIGKFQSRAAEKFGGPYSEVFAQPGLRKAISVAAASNTGIPYRRLCQEILSSRGEWPDQLFRTAVQPDEYVDATLRQLLFTGMFVPVTKIHCGHCRVESWKSANSLSSIMNCEFCGQDFYLAGSHALAKPEWRYRLAEHLPPTKIQSLLPALATTSLLSQLIPGGGYMSPYTFGLEVEINGHASEVDVAMYLGSPHLTMVLGEVKTGNRIDSADAENLFLLQQDLIAQKVRCILLFATLKDALSDDEIVVLRDLVERSPVVKDSLGRKTAFMPLVFTNQNLSLPKFHDDHPWRWALDSNGGIAITAIESCKKNLGLDSYRIVEEKSQLRIQCTWDSMGELRPF